MALLPHRILLTIVEYSSLLERMSLGFYLLARICLPASPACKLPSKLLAQDCLEVHLIFDFCGEEASFTLGTDNPNVGDNNSTLSATDSCQDLLYDGYTQEVCSIFFLSLLPAHSHAKKYGVLRCVESKIYGGNPKYSNYFASNDLHSVPVKIDVSHFTYIGRKQDMEHWSIGDSWIHQIHSLADCYLWVCGLFISLWQRKASLFSIPPTCMQHHCQSHQDLSSKPYAFASTSRRTLEEHCSYVVIPMILLPTGSNRDVYEECQNSQASSCTSPCFA